MRPTTVVALALSVTLATLSACCDAKERALAVDDEEESRSRPLYREYAVRRAALADGAFYDYGHLRFGRSDE